MPRLRLLLDENIGRTVAGKFRKDQHDIVSVLENYRGQGDEAILRIALTSKRIIVTLDKDFGTLVHLHSHEHTGVILLRLDDESPENIYKILKPILKQLSKKSERPIHRCDRNQNKAKIKKAGRFVCPAFWGNY